jgi:hypothetical protein
MLSAAQHHLEITQPAAYWKERDQRESVPWPLAALTSLVQGGRGSGASARSAEVQQLQQFVTITTEADAVVARLRGQAVRPKGLPRWAGDLAAAVLGAAAPKGLDFARYSIDYHYLRNYLYARAAWGPERAARQTPDYVKVLVNAYDQQGWVSKLEAEVAAEAGKDAAQKADASRRSS